uniref:Uncharacterized protein n=1 Tax=Manihot esculenta TaxID=3983 RepID=A0A2C9UZ31_MANES
MYTSNQFSFSLMDMSIATQSRLILDDRKLHSLTMKMNKRNKNATAINSTKTKTISEVTSSKMVESSAFFMVEEMEQRKA